MRGECVDGLGMDGLGVDSVSRASGEGPIDEVFDGRLDCISVCRDKRTSRCRGQIELQHKIMIGTSR